MSDEAAFTDLSYNDLKAKLKERGLSARGKKEALLQRLQEAAATTDSGTEATEPEKSATNPSDVVESTQGEVAADVGESTSEAVEVKTETDKRPRDGSEAEENKPKRQAVETEATPEAPVSTWNLPEGTPYVLKSLLPDSQAGLIIGKGGSTISSIHKDSGAKVQLSRNNIFFPGTQERVLLFSAETMNPVLIAFSLVLAKQFEALAKNGGKDVTSDSTAHVAKLLVPHASAGLIIGRGGSVIKRIASSSGARVQLAQKNDMLRGVGERIVTIQGTMEQQLECTKQIFSAMHFDEMSSSKSTYRNPAVDYAPSPNVASMSPRPYPTFNASPFQQRFAPTQMMQRQPFVQQTWRPPYPQMQPRFNQAPMAQLGMGGSTTVKVQVPDGMVGAIIGSGGSKIQEIQQFSGAQVRISNKGEYVSGTQNRIVSMSGTMEQCKMAQMMIQKAMDSANQSPYSGSRSGGRPM